jgi:hypothetical protein
MVRQMNMKDADFTTKNHLASIQLIQPLGLMYLDSKS